MSKLLAPRWQAALVVLLFLGSLALLLSSVLASLDLPQQELRVRKSLQEAGQRLSARAAELEQPAPESRLRELAEAVLADFPGVEGGFFLASRNAFVAYAYPSSPHPLGEPGSRSEPPPL